MNRHDNQSRQEPAVRPKQQPSEGRKDWEPLFSGKLGITPRTPTFLFAHVNYGMLTGDHFLRNERDQTAKQKVVEKYRNKKFIIFYLNMHS